METIVSPTHYNSITHEYHPGGVTAGDEVYRFAECTQSSYASSSKSREWAIPAKPAVNFGIDKGREKDVAFTSTKPHSNTLPGNQRRLGTAIHFSVV